MEHKVTKQIIQRYLKEECSASELQAMNLFLQSEDTGKLIDQVWAEEWSEFEEKELTDEEIGIWKNRFKEKCLTEDSSSTDKTKTNFFTFRYAAIWITMLFSLGLWYGINRLNIQGTETMAVTKLERVNANGQRVQIRLSDSSIVYLGGGSKLSYPSQFTGDTREVSLDGEAFFEIAKNQKKTFIIRTGELQTLVMGTSFRINAFKNKPFLVEVATGKIKINHQHQKNTLAELTPGQTMSWKNNQVLLGEINADDVTEWKNGRLSFNRATLREIASTLKRWYDVDIIFKNQVKADQHITITLTANIPLSDIMEVLASTSKFKYQIQGRQVIIN